MRVCACVVVTRVAMFLKSTLKEELTRHKNLVIIMLIWILFSGKGNAAYHKMLAGSINKAKVLDKYNNKSVEKIDNE